MLSSLNISATGLAAASAQVDNVMNNIANENTPGYKKRVVNIAESPVIGTSLTGSGVSIGDTTRVTNIYMYDNLTAEQSKQSQYDQLSTMLSDVEGVFSETEQSGLSADLDRYFQSLESLRASPSNLVYKSDVQTNGTILVDDLKTLYSGIEKLQVVAKNTVYDNIDSLNSLLNNIGDINFQIASAPVASNDLLDKRDQIEQSMAKLLDIKVDRSDNYQLSISKMSAVRYDTNIHHVDVVESSVAQKDIYATDARISNLVNNTWDGSDITAEVEGIMVTGTSTGTVNFLETAIAGSVSGDTNENTIDKIIADKANVISNWNTNHPDREIADITKTSSSYLSIQFKSTEGDVLSLSQNTDNGISFAKGTELTKGVLDSVTYKLNNDLSVSVHYGDVVSVPKGTDPETYEDITVDKTNVVRALVAKINSDPSFNTLVEAYNGDYKIDENGDKVLANNPKHPYYDSSDPNQDRYVVIESKLPGESGRFVGQMIVEDSSASNAITEVDKSKLLSVDGTDSLKLEIFDKSLALSSGSLKSMLDNLTTNSANNLFETYKQGLDNLAKVLSDLSASYLQNSDGSYVYGANAVNLDENKSDRIDLNLFSGSSVNTLKFNNGAVSSLTQNDLDYLSSLQWKEDINFDGTGENNTSFSSYYQSIRVKVSNDKENVDFKKDAQDAVTQSLQATYDKLTKVDKDEEMMNLIKFQAAYTANAKLVTVMDQMIQTLLGMGR